MMPTLLIAALALARSDAVDLVIPGQSQAAQGFSPGLAIAVAAAMVAAAGVFWLMMASEDPMDAEFSRLTRDLALSRAQRRLLRDLAASLGLPGPIPVLLSASARARAAESLGVARSQMAELERRIPPL
ncbi:MAG: hypothetical protein IT437_00640 [Phycisphaerales bacterium]|nr:hypothetical protein [Phycisphaerales bacterium]